jgi:hypothetical protein
MKIAIRNNIIIATTVISENAFEGCEFAEVSEDLRGFINSLIKPMWNGSEVYESATAEEIAEANKPILPSQARSMNLRLVLIQNGISIQDVYDAIASLPSPHNALGYQMFEYATHYDRNNAMINTLAQLMNISQEQLDNFFIQAENLVI